MTTRQPCLQGHLDFFKGCHDCAFHFPEALAERCTAIADQVVPRYRDGQRSYSCGGTVAQMWQATWDGACVALGGNPKDYQR